MSLKSKRGLITKISQLSRPNPKKYDPSPFNINSFSREESSNSPTPPPPSPPPPSAGAFSNAFSNAFNI
jgi:hypothetical protein